MSFKKVLIVAACVFAVILAFPVLMVAGFVVLVALNQRADADNPMRRPNAEIRADLLELTPIGTSMEDVIHVIDSHQAWEWRDRFIAPVGFPTGIPSYSVGVQSIRANIGYFWSWKSGNNRGYVTAWWGFDENEKLIDIRVRGISVSP